MAKNCWLDQFYCTPSCTEFYGRIFCHFAYAWLILRNEESGILVSDLTRLRLQAGQRGVSLPIQKVYIHQRWSYSSLDLPLVFIEQKNNKCISICTSRCRFFIIKKSHKSFIELTQFVVKICFLTPFFSWKKK